MQTFQTLQADFLTVLSDAKTFSVDNENRFFNVVGLPAVTYFAGCLSALNVRSFQLVTVIADYQAVNLQINCVAVENLPACKLLILGSEKLDYLMFQAGSLRKDFQLSTLQLSDLIKNLSAFLQSWADIEAAEAAEYLRSLAQIKADREAAEAEIFITGLDQAVSGLLSEVETKQADIKAAQQTAINLRKK